MSELPLNSVENTREKLAQAIDNNANFTRSSIELSMTEKRVIGGLKQLTELLFKQHFKHNYNDENVIIKSDDVMKSDEVTTSTEYEASSTCDMQTNEQINGNFQKFLDNAMPDGHAESFCAMVVKQLTRNADHVDHREEWHRGQLDAYNMAHEQMFERFE